MNKTSEGSEVQVCPQVTITSALLSLFSPWILLIVLNRTLGGFPFQSLSISPHRAVWSVNSHCRPTLRGQPLSDGIHVHPGVPKKCLQPHHHVCPLQAQSAEGSSRAWLLASPTSSLGCPPVNSCMLFYPHPQLLCPSPVCPFFTMELLP